MFFDRDLRKLIIPLSIEQFLLMFVVQIAKADAFPTDLINN